MFFLRNFSFVRRFSTDRPETISSALKRFYLKVHPDLFTQHPKEKDVNEKSLQLVSAYLSSLQRKEYAAAITVTFFTKLPRLEPAPAPLLLTSHRIRLDSKDLLISVNSILNGLNLPMIDVPKTSDPQIKRNEIHFKIVDIEKFYDFTKIPKISIETWLTSNIDVARTMAKRHRESLKDINEKVNGIKQRFHLDSIEYSDEWSVPQFYACLKTLLTYANKWQERLSSLRGKRLIFGDKTCLLQDGSLELGANDPPVYWDHVICFELLESDEYMKKILFYENHLSNYFQGIEIRRDPDSDHLSRAHTYLHHLIQLSQHLDLNRQHDAHQKFSWRNFHLFINPFSSEPSLTNSGIFQINSYDATMDILDFMTNHREKAQKLKKIYEKETKKENYLCQSVRDQFQLTEISSNRRIRKEDIIHCYQRLLDQRERFVEILTKCRLKIDQNYNLAQNGTISIPWNWSFAHEETF